MKYWQIAAGSDGRDYVTDFIRFGMAFVGGPKHVARMKEVQLGDRLVLKQGTTAIAAVGTVVNRGQNHSGVADKQWLRDYDGWDLEAYCFVDWRVPPKPIVIGGLSRGTIKALGVAAVQKAADQVVLSAKAKLRVDPEPPEVNPLSDDEILDFLIKEGLRPGAAEDLTSAFRRIRLLARHYYNNCHWPDIREHETRTFLILPLLLALGWSEQQIKIELSVSGIGRIDVACFSKSYARDSAGQPNDKDCVLVIETKGFASGLTFTHSQAKKYAIRFPACKAVVVSNGYCYKTYRKDNKGSFSEYPSAYLNLLSPKKRYPLDPEKVAGGLEVLQLLLTQSWR